MWNKLLILKYVSGKCLQSIKENRCPYKLMEWEPFIKIKASAWIVDVAGLVVWLEGCMEAFTVLVLIAFRAHVKAFLTLALMLLWTWITHLCPSPLGDTTKWRRAVHLFACDSFSSWFGLYLRWKWYLNAKKENKKIKSALKNPFPRYPMLVKNLGKRVELTKRGSLHRPLWGKGVASQLSGVKLLTWR